VHGQHRLSNLIIESIGGRGVCAYFPQDCFHEFRQIFARQVQGLARRGDVLFALTTSGRSPNILAALRTAREMGVTTVGFTGAKGESLHASCDHLFIAPSDDTPVIQQIHMMAMHAICDEVEQALIGATKIK
jgi:D-sedoheptulose 7-phosphate isomerase